MVKDPACGVEVDEKITSYKSIHDNKVYYFCCAPCKARFDKNPEQYVQKETNTHHASHYGGYCPTPGCNKPAKGPAWYFYIGLLFLILLLLLFFAL